MTEKSSVLVFGCFPGEIIAIGTYICDKFEGLQKISNMTYTTNGDYEVFFWITTNLANA